MTELAPNPAPNRVPRLLVVEDEPLIALTLEDMLGELGYAVVATVSRIDDALEFIGREPIDGALLDVNLGRDRIDPVAERLAGLGCPFLFSTGEGQSGLPSGFRHCAFVAKPFRIDDLAAALAKVLPRAET